MSDLARQAGINRSTVAALCRGTASRIELAHIAAICLQLNCQVNDLLQVVPGEQG
jgi:putative transcriptional regulator